jgi:hypothetical protein
MVDQLDSKEIPVQFRDEDIREWRNLGMFTDTENAIKTCNVLCRLCMNLNRESEGVHLIEHVLLRPIASQQHTATTVDDDFYRFRMTLVFPDWTARCHDAKFREMVGNLVIANSPAHIYPHILWLDFLEMIRFEKMFNQWLMYKSSTSPDSTSVDLVAGNIVEFLYRSIGPGLKK